MHEAFSVQEAAAFIAEHDVVILDVRTPAEFNQGHLDGAINIDIYNDTFNDTIQQLDRSQTYVLYCRTGSRSAAAQALLIEKEFQETYNVLGGIIAWTDAGLPVTQ